MGESLLNSNDTDIENVRNLEKNPTLDIIVKYREPGKQARAPKHLHKFGEYSVEFIAKVMELIKIQEKTGLATAFMVRGVLESIYEGRDIFSIVASVGFNGR